MYNYLFNYNNSNNNNNSGGYFNNLINTKNGQIYISIGNGMIQFQVQPWMAMMIGVFLIITVFRVYEYISSGEWKNRNIRKRKDSIGDPLLMIRQMINTKPKRFADIFPEELKELAKRRVNVLKEKDPFNISKLFPAYAFLTSFQSSSRFSRGFGGFSSNSNNSNLNSNNSSGNISGIGGSNSGLRKSILGNSTSSTPPPFNKLKKKSSQVIFHTPQQLNSTNLEKEPSPLFLSPAINENTSDIENIDGTLNQLNNSSRINKEKILSTIETNEILNNTNPNNNINPHIINHSSDNVNNGNTEEVENSDFNNLNYNVIGSKALNNIGGSNSLLPRPPSLESINNIPKTTVLENNLVDGNDGDSSNNIEMKYDSSNIPNPIERQNSFNKSQSLRKTWSGTANIENENNINNDNHNSNTTIDNNNSNSNNNNNNTATSLSESELPYIEEEEEDYDDTDDEHISSKNKSTTLNSTISESVTAVPTATSTASSNIKSSINESLNKTIPNLPTTNSTSANDNSYNKPKFPSYNHNKVQPSTNFGLVGLALSGGGIRSATFNLGLLQALSKHKLFKRIDYLSTVSGGGFIGSCLISLLSEGTYTSDWHNFPFHYGRGLKEGTPLTHLRNSANYLANGIFEFLLFPVLILRGIVLNLISIFPFVWALLLFERYVPVQFGEGYHISLRVAWNLLIHIIIFPLISRPKVTIPVLVAFVFFYYSELSKYFSKISNIDLGISIILHLYLNFPMIFRKEGSKVWYDRSFGWLFIMLIAGAFIESLPLIEVVYTYYFGGASESSFRVYPLISLFALILADSLAFTLLTNPKLSPWKRLVFHIIVSVIGPILLILTYLELSVWLDSTSPLFGIGNGMCFFISLLSFFSLDINETSMHKYYRDRLSKAYMFSIKNGRFRPYGGEKISRLNRRSVAPYLLVNTTLNSVSNSDGLELPNSRGSDFFIFSQHYCGSESSGYRSTEQMERLDRRLDLATAVSISGAAVGTKMGTATIPTLVMSMGILNIRLGYWLPNPLGIFLSHPFLGRVFYGGFACYHLVKEFGWTPMTSKDWCINLSDGGHIENLGAYELIKRRCKFIIISDAEADPDMTFPSMAQLMRLVRIDFGINIQINLDDIRRNPQTGYSKKHWTVGKIIYQKKKNYHQDTNNTSTTTTTDNDTDSPPSGEVGYLLYIKSSLTGDEDEIIKEYQSQHPSFPHESTTDQFFTEAQFESYRSLGYHIGGSSLFGPKYNRLFNGENLEEFFEKIYLSCNGELPKGWKEKVDNQSGSKYFVQEDMKKTTWYDPRIKKNHQHQTNL